MKLKVNLMIIQLVTNSLISYFLLWLLKHIFKLFNIHFNLIENICLFVLMVVLLFLINFYVAIKIRLGDKKND